MAKDSFFFKLKMESISTLEETAYLGVS